MHMLMTKLQDKSHLSNKEVNVKVFKIEMSDFVL